MAIGVYNMNPRYTLSTYSNDQDHSNNIHLWQRSSALCDVYVVKIRTFGKNQEHYKNEFQLINPN